MEIIPNEIIRHLTVFLSANDREQFRITCKRFREVLQGKHRSLERLRFLYNRMMLSKRLKRHLSLSKHFTGGCHFNLQTFTVELCGITFTNEQEYVSDKWVNFFFRVRYTWTTVHGKFIASVLKPGREVVLNKKLQYPRALFYHDRPDIINILPLFDKADRRYSEFL
jgi:hypothetical protein